MTEEQERRLEAFFISQLGGSYRSVAWFTNFFCCLYPCTSGASFDEIDRLRNSTKVPSQRHWFCSELIAAGLIYADLINNCKFHPCVKSPTDLYRLLTRDVYVDANGCERKRATWMNYTQIVRPDVLVEKHEVRPKKLVVERKQKSHQLGWLEMM